MSRNAAQVQPASSNSKSPGFTSEAIFVTHDLKASVKVTIRHVRNIQDEMEAFCVNIDKSLEAKKSIHRIYRIQGKGNSICLPSSHLKIGVVDLFDCMCKFISCSMGPAPTFIATLVDPLILNQTIKGEIEMYDILSFDSSSSVDLETLNAFGCASISRSRRVVAKPVVAPDSTPKSGRNSNNKKEKVKSIIVPAVKSGLISPAQRSKDEASALVFPLQAGTSMANCVDISTLTSNIMPVVEESSSIPEDMLALTKPLFMAMKRGVYSHNLVDDVEKALTGEVVTFDTISRFIPFTDEVDSTMIPYLIRITSDMLVHREACCMDPTPDTMFY